MTTKNKTKTKTTKQKQYVVHDEYTDVSVAILDAEDIFHSLEEAKDYATMRVKEDDCDMSITEITVTRQWIARTPEVRIEEVK